jgi:hypothetical protein
MKYRTLTNINLAQVKLDIIRTFLAKLSSSKTPACKSYKKQLEITSGYIKDNKETSLIFLKKSLYDLYYIYKFNLNHSTIMTVI